MPIIEDLYSVWLQELIKPIEEISSPLIASIELDAARRGADFPALLATGALTAAFTESMHPRGKDGKFIELMGWVNVDAGRGESKRGQVKNIEPGPDGKPQITVEFFDPSGTFSQGTETVSPNVISDAKNAKAHLPDAPDAPDVPGIPATPTKREATGGRDWPIDMYGSDLSVGLTRVDESGFQYVTPDGRSFAIDSYGGGMSIEETTDADLNGEAASVPTIGMTVPEDAGTAIDDYVAKNPLKSLDEIDADANAAHDAASPLAAPPAASKTQKMSGGAITDGPLDKWYQAQATPGTPDTYGKTQAKDLSDEDLDAAITERQHLNDVGSMGMSGTIDLKVLEDEKASRGSKPPEFSSAPKSKPIEDDTSGLFSAPGEAPGDEDPADTERVQQAETLISQMDDAVAAGDEDGARELLSEIDALAAEHDSSGSFAEFPEYSDPFDGPQEWYDGEELPGQDSYSPQSKMAGDVMPKSTGANALRVSGDEDLVAIADRLDAGEPLTEHDRSELMSLSEDDSYLGKMAQKILDENGGDDYAGSTKDVASKLGEDDLAKQVKDDTILSKDAQAELDKRKATDSLFGPPPDVSDYSDENLVKLTKSDDELGTAAKAEIEKRRLAAKGPDPSKGTGKPIIKAGNKPGSSAGPVIDWQSNGGTAWDPDTKSYVKFDGTPLTDDELFKKGLSGPFGNGGSPHGDAPRVTGHEPAPTAPSAPAAGGDFTARKWSSTWQNASELDAHIAKLTPEQKVAEFDSNLSDARAPKTASRLKKIDDAALTDMAAAAGGASPDLQRELKIEMSRRGIFTEGAVPDGGGDAPAAPAV